jgi:hypothetical protein
MATSGVPCDAHFDHVARRFKPAVMATGLMQPVDAVVAQHLEDAAILRATRTLLIRSPHTQLDRLDRLDERLAGTKCLAPCTGTLYGTKWLAPFPGNALFCHSEPMHHQQVQRARQRPQRGECRARSSRPMRKCFRFAARGHFAAPRVSIFTLRSNGDFDLWKHCGDSGRGILTSAPRACLAGWQDDFAARVVSRPPPVSATCPLSSDGSAVWPQ